MGAQAQAAESNEAAVPNRLRRFLKRSWRQKFSWVAQKGREAFSRIPRPVRLSFGAYFFRRHDFLGLNLGKFETRELEFASQYIRPGMTVLDVGAHQGLYTILASRRVGPLGRVFSFEPSPRERRALRVNLALNFSRNVRVEGLALGSQETTADLYIVDRYYTGYNSFRPPKVPQSASILTVQVNTLDGWLTAARIDQVDFIKLDVEGAELSVLKGARECLAKARPVLLVEVAQIRTAAWGYDAAEIVRFLERMGYKWFEILDGGRLLPLTQIDPQEMNLAAIPQGAK